MPDTPGPFEWAVAHQALDNQPASGDRSFVAARGDGVLVAVVDGLGHGEEAALAAREAIETLSADVEEDLPALVERCHRALRRTRGAVMALAVLRGDGELHWTGVGNIQTMVVRGKGHAREHAVLVGGVLGLRVPPVHVGELRLEPGDALILATDGIEPAFLDELAVGSPQRTADDILRRHATGRDDALVLVVRYREGRA